MTPEAIVAAARTWLGVPWRHQGRTRAGVDCVGHVVKVGHDLGATDFDTCDYGRYPRADELRATLRQHAIELEGEPAAGMIALMCFAREPRHLGIITPYRYGGLAIVHALSTAGRVAEHRLTPEWRRHIVGLFDFPGVER